MIIEEKKEIYFIHKLTIGKTNFAFKFDRNLSKTEVIEYIADRLIYIDRDIKTKEILFYKKTTDLSRGSGYMDFWFDFPEDNFTEKIDVSILETHSQIVDVFYDLLDHFKQFKKVTNDNN